MPEHALPYWPRFLRAEKAAAYLDISPGHFRSAVAPQLQAVRLGPHIVGWLREDLDQWLDYKAGRTAPAEEPNPWDALTVAPRPLAKAIEAALAKGQAKRAAKKAKEACEPGTTGSPSKAKPLAMVRPVPKVAPRPAQRGERLPVPPRRQSG